MTDDHDLVARAVRGEPGALNALAAAHRPAVVRIARHILGDPSTAEDVTQDVFVRLQASLPGFRGDAELGTWLYRVTLNLCRDHYRRRKRRPSVPISQGAGPEPRVDAAAETALDAERTRLAVRAALDRLPDELKEAVLLRYISDLSYAEIARVTAVPAGTVASRIYRGLKRLAEELEPRHLELLT